MKFWNRQSAIVLCVCWTIAITALIGYDYFQNVSQRIYEDSTGHLVELYSQVNHNFSAFLERNWGALNDWGNYIFVENEESMVAFLNERQKFWGFSQLYFLSEDGSYRTPEGETGRLMLEDAGDALFKDGEQIMSNETLSSGRTVTVFAIPVRKGTWQGFPYSAIAVSYTNADMVRSLNVDAFAGQSVCFVTDKEGKVFLSTQEGGSIFRNYRSYLKAASDLDEAALARMAEDWQNGRSGVVSCQINGVNYYISYQDVGYYDCVLLGVVPEKAASDSLLRIQSATANALLKVFLLAGSMAIVWGFYGYRQKSKKSDQEIRSRELMFDTLSNNVDDIFLMLDGKTLHVDFLSSNVERLLGVSHEMTLNNIAILGESVADTAGAVTKEEFVGIPLDGSRQWEREHVHHGTGERRWYRETIYHKNIDGMEKYLVVMSDRTEERKMNQKLQNALDTARSANEAKSHFLSNMSHDIRTPMNAIIGFSVLLARDADKADKVREYTRKISASGQHLLSLINDVLDMSKIESGKTSLNVSQFSLPELIEELYTIILPQAKAKRQVFQTYVEGRPAEQLIGDKLHLNQILINLLSNAVKYTREGGRIDFLVEELEKTSQQNAYLRFVVRDNGIGMSEEFLKVVFEPFVRDSSSAAKGIQGTGLGMAITKNLVELMGGTIGVESREGRGSVFTVEMSFALPTPEEDREFWPRKGISRVLVADDDENICTDVRDVMENTGVEVAYVTDGLSAVEAAVHAQETGRAFHVILLDWKMPGLDGIKVARQIREKINESIPILVLTSYDWSDIEEEALAAGIDAFLPKPFFVSNFRRVLSTLDPVGIPTEPVMGESVLEGMRFLVAEDNELNAEILSEMLNMEGACCELAVNGREALDLFQESEPGYYDMILMDVQMPVMNGYEATRAIRACEHSSARSIPVIAMTANAFAEDVRDAMQAGMNDHMAKPIDMDKMKVVIGRFRREKNPGKENEYNTVPGGQ